MIVIQLSPIHPRESHHTVNFALGPMSVVCEKFTMVRAAWFLRRAASALSALLLRAFAALQEQLGSVLAASEPALART